MFLKVYAAKSIYGQLGSSEMLCFIRRCLNACAAPIFNRLAVLGLLLDLMILKGLFQPKWFCDYLRKDACAAYNRILGKSRERGHLMLLQNSG